MAKSSSLGSMPPPGGEAPPGGRGAPGGTAPPAPPGGRPPRLSIGRGGRARRRPVGLPGASGRLRPGQKQRVTTKLEPDRRKQFLDALKSWHGSRPDLTNEGQADGYKPRLRLGRKTPARTKVSQAGEAAEAAAAGETTPPPQAASGAGAPPKSKKKSGKKVPPLGSPGHDQPEIFTFSKAETGQEDVAGYTAEEAKPNPATAEDLLRKAQLEKSKHEVEEEYRKRTGQA